MSGPETQGQPPEVDQRRSLVERAKNVGSSARVWLEAKPMGVQAGAAVAAIVVLIVLVGAITSAFDSQGDPGDDASTGAVPVTTGAQSTTASTGVSESNESPFQAALERSEQAGSYRFDAVLMLRSGEKTAEVRLSGWVDGADRELTVHSGEDLVATTKVIDGVATFDDGSGPLEISLEEAGPAPGFELLDMVEVTGTTDNEIRGDIPAEALAAFQLGEISPKEGSVVIRYDQYIDGYVMRDTDGAWEMNVTFSGYGEEVSSS